MAVNSAVFCTLLFLVYCYNGQMSAVIWGSIDHATPWEVAPVHDYAGGRGYATKMSAYKTDDEVSAAPAVSQDDANILLLIKKQYELASAEQKFQELNEKLLTIKTQLQSRMTVGKWREPEFFKLLQHLIREQRWPPYNWKKLFLKHLELIEEFFKDVDVTAAEDVAGPAMDRAPSAKRRRVEGCAAKPIPLNVDILRMIKDALDLRSAPWQQKYTEMLRKLEKIKREIARTTIANPNIPFFDYLLMQIEKWSGERWTAMAIRIQFKIRLLQKLVEEFNYPEESAAGPALKTDDAPAPPAAPRHLNNDQTPASPPAPGPHRHMTGSDCPFRAVVQYGEVYENWNLLTEENDDHDTFQWNSPTETTIVADYEDEEHIEDYAGFNPATGIYYRYDYENGNEHCMRIVRTIAEPAPAPAPAPSSVEILDPNTPLPQCSGPNDAGGGFIRSLPYQTRLLKYRLTPLPLTI
eukprot:SAG31_NODE_2329_length_5933_cov_5.949263_2_plen_466_part_00